MQRVDWVLASGMFGSEFSTRLTLTLIHFLWQGCAIAIVLAFASWSFRRATSAQRYLINVAGLLLMAACIPTTFALVTVSAPELNPRAQLDVESGNIGTEDAAFILQDIQANQSPNRGVATGDSEPSHVESGFGATGSGMVRSASPIADSSWMVRCAPYTTALYITGVLAMFLRLVTAVWGGWRLRQSAVAIDDAKLLAMVLRQSRRLGIKALPTIAWCRRVSVPVVVGIVRPLILLPASLASGLTPDQLESLLTHELAHIRRWDLIVNLLQRFIEAILFFHPAVWYVSRRVSLERENACDDLVLAAGWQRLHYADALVRMAELCAANRIASTCDAVLVAAAGDRPSQFKRRVLRLLTNEPAAPLKLGRAGVAGVVLSIVALLIAVWTGSRADGGGVKHENETLGGDSIVSTDTPASDLTPGKIAEQIEATMRTFASVEYKVSFTETKDANAFGNAARLPVTGDGSFEYLSDETRWFALERGFTVNLGKPHMIPSEERSGFDGTKHFIGRDGRFVLGETDFADLRCEPRTVFWHGAKSTDWLLNAIKHKSARIDRYATIDERDCVVIVSDPIQRKPGDTTSHDWHYEITIAPEQSWLPVKTVIQVDGKPEATETIDEMDRTPQGVWYPKLIRFEQLGSFGLSSLKKVTRIEKFELRDTFGDAEFRNADPLPIGQDIVDYRRSRIWHNDPWWPELAPFLESRFSWPRPYVGTYDNIASYADKAIQGKPAPPIQASQWINGDAGDWKRAGRKLTALHFFGGQAASPTPQWMAALRSLYERYRKDGLDVVCVTTAASDSAVVRRTIKSLNIPFPVAIDTRDDTGKGFGRTYDAYGLKSYGGVLLIGDDQRVILVDPTELPADAKVSQLEHLIRQQLLGSSQKDAKYLDSQLSDMELQEITAEWKRLRTKSKPGDARLWALLKFPGVTPTADGHTAKWEIVPELRLLNSNTPGGWTVFGAEPWTISSDEGCDIFNLPKGTYRLTVRRTGFASVERNFTLPAADTGKPLDISMTPGDSIRGQVLDSANNPIAGATIKPTKRYLDPAKPLLFTTAHLPFASTTANDQGQFEFSALFEGSYSLQVSADGFETADIDFVPAGKQDVKVTLVSVKAKAVDAKASGAKGAELNAAERTPSETRFSRPQRSAFAVHSDERVYFVLYAPCFLQSGLSKTVLGTGEWRYEGHFNLLEGNAVVRRVNLRFTSQERDVLYLDDKPYRMDALAKSDSTDGVTKRGRLFILRKDGEPLQTARTLPLKAESDLDPKREGSLAFSAESDLRLAETDRSVP